MNEILGKLRNVSNLRELSELVSPASVATAAVVLLATWYLVYLLDTFVASNLKAIPGSPSELAIPYYNVYKQVTGNLRTRIMSAHEKHGSIVRIAPDKISIADPDTLQELLKLLDIPKHKATYNNIQNVKNRPNIAFTTDRTDHRRQRRVIAPAFSVKYLMNLEPHLLEAYSALERKILSAPSDSDGYMTVDMFKGMHHVAGDVIAITAFGENFRLVETGTHPYITSVAQLVKAMAIRMAVPSFARDVYNTLVYDKINRFQSEYAKGCINKRREANASGDFHNDILQWIVNQGEKGVFDEVDMANMVRTMLGAGSETTANTMAWAMSLLVTNPAALEKLRKELDEAFPGSPQQSLPLETLKHLPYLNAVLHETLRVKPILAQVWREFEEDTELTVRDDEGNPTKYIIPAGTMTYIPIAAVHNSPKVWLRANEFYPERWLDEADKVGEEEIDDNSAAVKSSNGTHGSKGGYWGKPVLCNKQAFIPFSLGSRDCVGRNFAWNEMRIIMGHLVRRFDILPAYDTSVEVPGADFFTYQIKRPDGLPIRFRPRV